jgi:dihydrofolate synthase/folylpolyglutamate synthase
MGGRLDSTNVITPLISVITNIGLDHTAFLGNTLPLIATEKAGIIKNNIPVVIGEYTEETKAVFDTKAKARNAAIYFASDLISENYPSALLGNYQRHNTKTVLQTISVLQSQKQFVIEDDQIRNGLLKVIQNTGLQGRWQQLQEHPKVICDTAHNAAGLKSVMDQLHQEPFKDLHIVLGVVNDKDLTEILPLFPKNATYYFCKPNIPRGLETNILKDQAAKNNLTGAVYASVSDAYQAALTNADASDFIYIGGSTFVVAEIL